MSKALGDVGASLHRLGFTAALGSVAVIAAFKWLQAAVESTMDRCKRLECEVAEARAALTRVRAELRGRAGERRARHLALHDGLTALPNRRALLESVNEALECREPGGWSFAVLFLDLDDFKPINDRYGHSVGYELLRIVSARLSRAVRAEDTMSRFGGNEFACVVAGLPTRAHLRVLARKLREEVSRPVSVDALVLHVHASIGIAMHPADGVSVEELLRSADYAMYDAKRSRSGFALVDPSSGSRGAGLLGGSAVAATEPADGAIRANESGCPGRGAPS